MKTLTQSQIKQQQLKLLETNGLSLGEFGQPNSSSQILHTVPKSLQIAQLQRLKVLCLRNIGVNSNANLRGFTLTLLSSIYGGYIRQDLLLQIKSLIYHPELDISNIKHSPLVDMPNKQMKKLVVQFFYYLGYASQEDKIQHKFCKYPVVMDILVLFLRTVMAGLKVKNAENYLMKLPMKDVVPVLTEYFDINCKITPSIYLFVEEKMFLCESSNGETFVGKYTQNDSNLTINTLTKNLGLSQCQQQIQQDTQNGRSPRQSNMSHNRSIQLKGIGESLILDHDAPTPFFNFDQNHFGSPQLAISNMKSSGEYDMKGRGNNFMRSSREGLMLKAIELTGKGQSSNYFGNLSKITKPQKQPVQTKESIAEDSPMALDFPPNFEPDSNLTKNNAKQEKPMKKSKSQSNHSVTNISPNTQQQTSGITKPMKKKQKVDYGKPSQKKGQNCLCKQQKSGSVKLISNLYQINMRYVPNPDNNRKIDHSKNGQYYISSKGINCQLYASEPQNTSDLRGTFSKHRVNLDNSINSCYVLPHLYKDSDTYSKRQHSPISNNGDRSFNSLSGAGSIQKIKFTYKTPKNAMKYSIQLPQQNPKS